MVLRTHYFVITPEVRTDETVLALRHGWMRSIPHERLHFCVAAGSDSSLLGKPTMLLLRDVQRGAGTPVTRDAYWHNREISASRRTALKESYNSFLRSKVLAMVREMAALASRQQLDYAFMLDYDTVTNTTNLDAFAAALPGAGGGRIYTGRCVQEPLTGGMLDASRRQEVAFYISLKERSERLHLAAPQWDPRTPPSPGGGPGLLFSRGLLAALQPRLDECSSLTRPGAMGAGVYTGGDSMLTRCLASFGVRCSSEADMGLDVRCTLPHGCSLLALFRKNPPWFYFAARRYVRSLMAQSKANHSSLSKSRKAIVNAYDSQGKPKPAQSPKSVTSSSSLSLHVPLEATVAFHHVKPTARSATYKPDQRCGVRLKAKNAAHVGWWSSRCLPFFFLVGAPESGTTRLFAWVAQHPDVLLPRRKELGFWRPVSSPLSRLRLKPQRQLQPYCDLFPRIDPRDFKVTGEASPAYMYSLPALSFYLQPNMRMSRLIILLRQPEDRTVSEYLHTEQEGKVQWTGAEPLSMLARRAEREATACGLDALYDGCVPCARFVHADAGRGLQRRGGKGSGSAAAGPTDERAPSPPPPVARPASVGGAGGAGGARCGAWAAPPVLWQSWYHLFLPRWLGVGERLLLAFSDDLSSRPEEVMAAVAHHLRLPPHVYDLHLDLHLAANTKEKRGLHWWGRDNVVPRDRAVPRRGGTPTPNASGAEVSDETRHTLRRLMAASVRSLDELLRASSRPGVPAQWLRTSAGPGATHGGGLGG